MGTNKVGFLTLLDEIKIVTHKKYIFCRCDCGNEKFIYYYSLINGNTISCGCKSGCHTHHMTYTRIYSIWRNMISRCKYDSTPSQKRYSKNNIKVCKEWEIFEMFYNDMKDGYADNLSLDRKKNKLGYFKENCWWRTPKQQAENRDNTIFLTIDGVTKKLVDWATEKNINPITLRVRHHRGWSDEKCLLTPVRN